MDDIALDQVGKLARRVAQAKLDHELAIAHIRAHEPSNDGLLRYHQKRSQEAQTEWDKLVQRYSAQISLEKIAQDVLTEAQLNMLEEGLILLDISFAHLSEIEG